MEHVMSVPVSYPDWSLYLVTDPGYLPPGQFIEHILAAVQGGVSVVQLRDKQASDAQLKVQAQDPKERLGNRIPLFINDRVSLALDLELHLHIGQSDMPYVHARCLLPDYLMIGLSIENEEQLIRCIADCAKADVPLPNVIGIGPLQATSTKPDAAPPLGVEGIQKIAAYAVQHDIASVAIGGIGLHNAGELSNSDIDGICVVSALMASQEPVFTARQLRNTLRKTAP